MVGGGAEEELAPDTPLAEVTEQPTREELAPESDVAQRLVKAHPLFLRSGPHVLRRAFRSLSPEACEDVVQEALLRVVLKAAAGELAPDTNVMAYLRQTARNLAVDEYRKERRAGRRLVLLDMDSLETRPAEQEEEEDEERRKQRKWLHREISQMRDSQRRHVVALQSQGLSDVEIAAALGIPAARLHRLRNKAIAHLRRKLTGHIREGQRRKSLGRKDR